MVAENTMWISMCPSNLVGWIIKFYQIKRCCCWGDLHMMIINTFATTMTNKVKFRSKDPRGWTSERDYEILLFWILNLARYAGRYFFKAQNMCWTIDIMTLCLNSKSMKKPFLFHTHFLGKSIMNADMNICGFGLLLILYTCVGFSIFGRFWFSRQNSNQISNGQKKILNRGENYSACWR